jgi:DNA-binding beta-propeller fold protein YncE
MHRVHHPPKWLQLAPPADCSRLRVSTRRRRGRRRAITAGCFAYLTAVVAGTACVFACAAAAAGLPLTTVARVSLPGPANRFDYTSFDPSTGWLWISHMDGDQLLAFDTRSRKVVKTISAPGVHGVIAVPSLGRVYASATNAQQVLTIDSHTGKILNHAPAGKYPDGLAYDPVERHIFISDESGGVETVIDAAGNRIATISLGGSAGNVQYDTGSGKILAAVQTRDDIAVIDPRTNKIVRRVSVPNCVNDHSLYIDSPNHLAFVTCDGNAMLLTLDLRTMSFTGAFGVGDSPDVLAFDSSLRRLYVSAESGTVAVFAETGHSARRLGLSFLADEAHTVAVDPRTHLVYFPLQSGSSGGPQLLIMKPESGHTATARTTADPAPSGLGATTPGSTIGAAAPANAPAIGGAPGCAPGQTQANAGPGAYAGDSEDEDDFGGLDDGDGCI